MQYDDDNMLMLSGIQHFVFCPRQWALIHIEQQWAENKLTIEGVLLHSNVDDPSRRMLNNDTITLRSVHIASKTLGLYGVTDAVELIPTEDKYSITHCKYDGNFIPHPVEYKRGHSKSTNCDVMQLVAQVLCLEEFYGIKIPSASLFYWEVRRREIVEITDDLRNDALFYANEMHRIFESKIIPLPNPSAKCKNCSLIDICMPKVNRDVNDYLKEMMI